MDKIGILGGTFDPPHIGHLIVAEEARMALQLKEVWFIPSYEPPHKDQAKTSTDDRCTMLKEAIAGNERFKINDIEIARAGKSYTIDTMTQLREQYPNNEFYFIIGADMVEYLPHWKDIDKLVKLVTFVGVNRPEYELKTPYPITVINIPTIDISSTFIRNRIKNGQSAAYFIQRSVEHYIKEKRLYGYRSSD